MNTGYHNIREYSIDEFLAMMGDGMVSEDTPAVRQAVVRRNIASEIREASRYFPVITVTGPRQSGKTTLIRSHFSELNYYSLENLDTRSSAIADPRAFLNQHPEGMILDEVQSVPELLSYIQGIVDEHPEKRFILSGSNNFTLLKSMTQSLAGRSGVFELMPMALSEVMPLARDMSLDALLFRGLFPAVCTGKNIARYLYPAYIKTYIERDVRLLTNVKDLMQFRTFIRLCAARIGSVFNAAELGNEVGVSANTIRAWISILQTSYIIFLLPPYYENTGKRLTKSPKLYFCDTGLAASLLSINSETEMGRDKMRGHLFENLIVAEAYKRCLNEMREPNLFFYRDSNQNEVDLVEMCRDGLRAIEIKSAMTYTASFEKALKAFPKWVNRPVIDRMVVYAGHEERTEGDITVRNFLNAAEDGLL